MSFPGGIQYTNGGLLLSSKTLLGKQVTFTRLAVGDGELSGQSPLERTTLVHEVESIDINKLVLLSGTEATVGGPFSNQGLASGFWWREVGVFAKDPDTQLEKLYAYGNAGALADYIPAGGGAEILEKQVDITILVSTSTNISAIINSSLVYASAQDLLDHKNDGAAHGATVAATAGKGMLRDANGRSQVADASADMDAVNKRTLAASFTPIQGQIQTINDRLARENWDRSRVYDSQGRLSVVTFSKASVTKGTLTYNYNSLGRIGTAVLAVIGETTITETKQYDSQGRDIGEVYS